MFRTRGVPCPLNQNSGGALQSSYMDDTIAAISTPIGDGGIGIIRISGRDALRIAARVFRPPGGIGLEETDSHRVLYGHVVDQERGGVLDEVLVTVMKAPRSYTREDVVEINCHGGYTAVRNTLAAVLRAGARLAGPGEFTRRAFLNGRIDLAQAEAVLDLIRAKTDRAEILALGQLRGALSRSIGAISDAVTRLCVVTEAQIDFPDEDLPPSTSDEMVQGIRRVREEVAVLARGFDRGRLFREGVAAVIVGKPNVGKSSLLNALVMKDRAIVTSSPGTTRDVIEDYLDIEGLPVRIMDTAGIRESQDPVEKEGVQRSLDALRNADIVLAIFDGSREFDDLDRDILERVLPHGTIFVVNKSDISSPLFGMPAQVFSPPSPVNGSNPAWGKVQPKMVAISALTGDGMDDLRKAIYALCMSRATPSDTEGLLITNLRHKISLDKTVNALHDAENTLARGEPLEVAALFLREALQNLGEITGAVTTEDILDRIFDAFCIGK